MKALSSLLIVAVALVSSHAYADCVYPKAPDKLPDGATASTQEMVDAQKLVRSYNDQIKAYQDCLRQDHDAKVKADESKPERNRMSKEERNELDNITVQKSNAAYDEAEALTTRFNEQIRAFKAKGSDKKS